MVCTNLSPAIKLQKWRNRSLFDKSMPVKLCRIIQRKAWDTWSVFPAVTDVLADSSLVPESIPDDYMPLNERFVVLLYSRTSAAVTVNVARQELFLKKSRAQIENIPPTQAALLQHTKRAVYQASHVGGSALIAKPQIPSPQK